MKLVIATPLYPPDSGGPATYAHLLATHLPAAMGEKGERDEVALVKFSDVRHLPKVIRHLAYFFNVLSAAQKADVILALDPVSTGFPAILAAGILHKPFVVKIVGDFAWEQGRQRFGITNNLDDFVRQGRVPFPVAFLRSIQTFVAHHATRIIVPSHYLERIIITWGINPEKISVIYNSIEVEEKSGVHETGNVIVTVARLVPWKGISELIDAVATVRKEIPDASLLIIGDGPDEAILMEKGKKVLGDAISFAGPRSHEEVLQAMSASSVFVLNSTYEGLSHVLIEALHLGKVIVATDAGGNSELIKDDVNGILVPVGDTETLAKALVRALKDKDARSRFSAHARESSHRFAVPVMISMTRELLSSLTPSA